MGSCKRRFLVRQPWIACPKDPRTEGVKIPPVRGPCADFQSFMCIVLPPAGDFLPVAFLYKERVSDGLLFPIAGKVGKRASRTPWFLHFLLVCKSCGLSPAETGN